MPGIFGRGSEFLKAALPYVDPATGERLSLILKVAELSDSIHNAGQTPDLSAASIGNEQPLDMEGLLSSVRPLCMGRELEMVDMMLNFVKVRKMYSTYSSFSGKRPGLGAGNPLFDMLMQQMSPEQRQNFDAMQSML
ncbi:hypothetical protein [Anaerolentibacter hominis]|uniref:hypothetical protein n=1 Tax=Anaerolentibacter hominis TaxID=3079009 RepID=UPI0031B8ADAE